MRLPRLFLALLCLFAIAAVEDGWKAFRENRFPEAGQAFEAAGQTRGQAWIALLEGDDIQGAKLLARFLLEHPDDPTGPASWLEFVDAAYGTGQTELLQSTARALIDNPRAWPELRQAARSVLAEQSGGPDQLGYLAKWKILGPFDNVSRSGLNKPFPPEQGLAPGRSLPGKNQRLIGWQDLPATRNGFVSPGRFLADSKGEVYYATTAVSGVTGPVWLRLDPSGACQVWLNGKRIFYTAAYGSSSPSMGDVYTLPVELRAGWNTVLVKMASDEDSYEADFRMRFTAPDSDVSLSLQSDPAQVAAGAVQTEPAPATPPVPQSLARLEGSQEPDVPLLQAEVLLRVGRNADAARLLRQALEKAPDWAAARWYLSRALAKEEHEDEARLERDCVLKAAPLIMDAQIQAQREAIEAGQGEAAQAILRKLVQRSPANVGARATLYLALLDADLNEDAQRELKELLAVAPSSGNYELTIGLLAMDENRGEAEKLLTEALQRYPHDENLLRLQANLLEARGDTAGAIASYTEINRLYPDSDYSQEIAKLYRGSKDWKNVAATLEQARRYRPNDAYLAGDLADAYRELGQADKARELYSEAVRLDPGLVDMREKLALVSGQKPVLELVPDTEVQALLRTAPTQEQYPDAPAVFLLDQGRVVVYPDMASLRHYHGLVKVFDDAGARRYASVGMGRPSATARPVLEIARIYKADGKVQDVRDESARGRLNFPSLAPGDVLEYAYRVQDAPSGSLANHFWEDWRVSTDIPVRLSRYALISPVDLSRLKVQSHGPTMPQPTTRQSGDWQIREWVLNEVAPASENPLSAPSRDVSNWLEMSTIADWREVADWYTDLSGPRCVPDDILGAKARELTRDARTPEEKLRALQAFVARDIRYQTTPFRTSAYVPTDGKKVLDDRYGDCKDKSALLCAMLRSLGIDGKIVLLATRDEGLVARLPAPYFNHAITLVELPGKRVWVDATADSQELTVLPMDDQGVPALIVAADTVGLSPVPVGTVDEHRSMLSHKARLSADGALQGSLECAYTGQFGAGLRSNLAQLDRPSREKAIQAVVRRFVSERAATSRTEVLNLEDPDRPVVLKAQYKAAGYASSAGGFWLVPGPFICDRQTFAVLAQLLSQPGPHELELTTLRGVRKLSFVLELPRGMKPELPKATGQKLPHASYKLAYTAKGQTVVGEAELRLDVLRLSPAEGRELGTLLENFTRDLAQPILVRVKP